MFVTLKELFIDITKDEQVYICHDGRELRHINTEKKKQNGYTQIYEVYGCSEIQWM